MPNHHASEQTQASMHIGLSSLPMSVADKSKQRISLIVWIFVVMVFGLFLFAYFSIALLSSVRAYVEGEGHYSKGQKDAIYALSRYAQYGQAADYVIFRSDLSICQGDRKAREELEKREPDLHAAYDGFLQGRNHPNDIDGMIRLFLRLRHVSEISKAIDIWEAADRHIEDLSRIGERVDKVVHAGALSTAMSKDFLDQLHDINLQLTPLEDNFSATLGEAARKVKTLTLLTMCVGVSVLLSGAYVFSRRIVRQNEEAQDLLRDSKNQLQSVLQFAPLSMVIVRSADDVVVYANDRALEQFKIDLSMLSAIHPQSLYVKSDDRDILLAALKSDESVQDLELQLQDTRGKTFWASCSSQHIRYDEQDCILTALINIDDKKRALDDLHFRAFHDQLTGLPNRAMFMDSAERALGRLDRKNGVFSIMFIDLDHFKMVNDDIGHAMGDLLLQQVAGRIQSCVRRGDLVARLGGDEFVVLLEDLNESEELRSIAHKISKTLEPAYALNGYIARVTSSIGISSYPKAGNKLDTLLSAADSAMYRAKMAGRNNVQFHS